jgi:DNA-binding GntR family transcriptional regulator
LPALNKNKRKNTYAEKALIKIQDAIIKGELRPNQRIVESRLSRKLGMSRTPVREAIIKLQEMGRLTLLPEGGIVVAEYTSKRIKDIFEMREVLEALVTKDFCEHATDQQIARAEEYNRLTGQAVVQNKPADYDRYITMFHDTLLEACSNQMLVTIAKSMRDLSFESRVTSTLTNTELKRAVAKREAIVKAFHERNSTKAQRLIKDYQRWYARVSQRL